MSNHNNQQRRVSRRFKRHLRNTQHHQRGRIDGELCLMVGLGSLMVICALVAIAALCVAIDNADKCAKVTRIDWSAVPVENARPLPGPTENQRIFARERKRVYAALAFERQRP